MVPQGDISKATVSSPVPAQDVMRVFVSHSYESAYATNLYGYPVTAYMKQSVSAFGGMVANLLYVSPTGAIITSISSASAKNTKSEYYDVKLGASLMYRFNRLTVGSTTYPPLVYALERDVVGVYSAR